MRKGFVYYDNILAGIIKETDEGFEFKYMEDYLKLSEPVAISMTIPISEQTYKSNILFPFFDGLIPEGWLLNYAVKNWKLNPNDRMGLLLTVCEDCIGAVSVRSKKI